MMMMMIGGGEEVLKVRSGGGVIEKCEKFAPAGTAGAGGKGVSALLPPRFCARYAGEKRDRRGKQRGGEVRGGGMKRTEEARLKEDTDNTRGTVQRGASGADEIPPPQIVVRHFAVFVLEDTTPQDE
ncbi:hypothetical protein niasHT_018639 [Heterodera trifolii]|uniref:Uncharacterized protein n=1 Tax=Heterodera trifolii TaxID=157864 RepID=A0ABD2KZ95_9BILA